VTDFDVAALRDAYDAQLRAHVPDPVPAGTTVERDGPLVRMTGLDPGGFLTYRDLGGLDGAELDALIARQRDLFAERGQRVEWKLHGHDQPGRTRLPAPGAGDRRDRTDRTDRRRAARASGGRTAA
jgi:hypothetical protein